MVKGDAASDSGLEKSLKDYVVGDSITTTGYDVQSDKNYTNGPSERTQRHHPKTRKKRFVFTGLHSFW